MPTSSKTNSYEGGGLDGITSLLSPPPPPSSLSLGLLLLDTCELLELMSALYPFSSVVTLSLPKSLFVISTTMVISTISVPSSKIEVPTGSLGLPMSGSCSVSVELLKNSSLC